ncbi:unnamed protein product [Spirodela intermedia]|uniref:DUF4005 domain-containing protein n=1 Tax=Spirodela intermedia TaxID=51605 RepID=A0A7I8IEU8_SPIIN|nr:unnamed protein product [Spirodela intermedia]CAA6656320.1 unnamed protein product [Spirodela intermedia]
MAAATVAVAEAAVAAAQAAAAVVRLTGGGRCPGICVAGGKGELWAAVKIQAAFRGYLARRALRALRSLVKLQALVRGHIALLRAQVRRAHAAGLHLRIAFPAMNPGRSDPPTPQKCEPSSTRSSPLKLDKVSHVKRCLFLDGDGFAEGCGNRQGQCWNWLDRWMEERYWESREVSSSRADGATDEDETSDKILEVDTGRSHLNSRRRAGHNHNGRSFAVVQYSTPSRDSTAAAALFTARARPLAKAGRPTRAAALLGVFPAGSSHPAKSDCSRSFFSGLSEYPSYMAYTESSKAKFRSQSAPRQRPESEKPAAFQRVPVVGTRCGHSSSSSSQRPSPSFHVKLTGRGYPGSGRLDSLGMPSDTSYRPLSVSTSVSIF